MYSKYILLHYNNKLTFIRACAILTFYRKYSSKFIRDKSRRICAPVVFYSSVH